MTDAQNNTHFLTCLAEECGEVMDILHLSPENKIQLEFELNDVVGAAKLLNQQHIIWVDFNVSDQEESSNNEIEIFCCVKDIQHHTHKAIRFGMDSVNPTLKITNAQAIEDEIKTLLTLISKNKSVKLWDNHDDKITKIFKNLNISKDTLDPRNSKTANANLQAEILQEATDNFNIALAFIPNADTFLNKCSWIENKVKHFSSKCVVNGEIFSLLETDSDGELTNQAKLSSIVILTSLIENTIDVKREWITATSYNNITLSIAREVFDLALASLKQMPEILKTTPQALHNP